MNACGLTIDQQSPISQDAYLHTNGDTSTAKGTTAEDKRECASYTPTTRSDCTRINLNSTRIEFDGSLSL